MAARKVVTNNLGHGRISVTTAYTGSVLNIQRHQVRQMTELLGQLQAPGGALQAYMQALALGLGHEGELRVHVFKRRGPVHDGVLVLPSVPGGLSSVLTPRLKRPSQLITVRGNVHAVGSLAPGPVPQPLATAH